MEKLKQNLLYSRNQPFIDLETQEKLASLKIVLVGVGLASQLAQSLVRLGVKNLSLWDGDYVSITNLNRQAFSIDDLDKNKASASANYISRINPETKIEIHDTFFDQKDLEDGLKDADIVVNSADFNTSIIYEISETIVSKNGWCIQPFNLGFGGSCMVFSSQSPSLDDITLGRQTNSALFMKNLLDNCEGFSPSKKLMEAGEALLSSGEAMGYFPQNVIATLISTSLITWVIVQIAKENTENICAPRLLHFEPGTLIGR